MNAHSSSTAASRRASQPSFRFSGYLLSSIARQTPLLSRRTKVILLALVGIPLLYTVLTWAPREPLRFRVAGQHTPTSGNAYTSVGVVIENTSATPVCLFKADLTAAQASDNGASPEPLPATTDATARVGLFHPMEHPHRQMSDKRSMVIIPGHSTLEVAALVEHANVDAAKTGQLHFQYEWMSDTRRRASTALHWLRAHVPQSFQSKIPVLTDNQNSCPLQAAAGS
ncbi:hypothetical protein [Roseimicrobium sp. ORNL1]|uniref:hypothetical protein n=1 Tax=Roseimicrobium sp. ORNL1 TaxID=2711231 RepID=UPI0013E1F78B|nr:hypothetical protein [Roseimicrobium sp. ORNL1]QIF01972.1 hypothetical protein G5S37_10665 [Roseimicrobium sp. ORNL1]